MVLWTRETGEGGRVDFDVEGLELAQIGEERFFFLFLIFCFFFFFFFFFFPPPPLAFPQHHERATTTERELAADFALRARAW
jgi:hypothetical protein